MALDGTSPDHGEISSVPIPQQWERYMDSRRVIIAGTKETRRDPNHLLLVTAGDDFCSREYFAPDPDHLNSFTTCCIY